VFTEEVGFDELPVSNVIFVSIAHDLN